MFMGKKNVICIYGAAGSGTSTLGKYICDKLGYAFIDTDDIYWLKTDIPFTKSRDNRECISMIKEIINNNDNIVISGSLAVWGDEIIPFLTLAIRLVTDTKIRMERIKKRDNAKYGERIFPGGDMYENHQIFLKNAEGYDDNTVPRSKELHDFWQNKLSCKHIALSGNDSIEYNFEIISKELKKSTK